MVDQIKDESDATVTQSKRKVIVGSVISNKMDKTIVVQVKRKVKHAIGKYIRRDSKMYAHDEDNICGMGDTVRIEECRPLSKTKRWKLVELVKQFQG